MGYKKSFKGKLRWSSGARLVTLPSIRPRRVKILQKKNCLSSLNWCDNHNIPFQLYFETPNLFLASTFCLTFKEFRDLLQLFPEKYPKQRTRYLLFVEVLCSFLQGNGCQTPPFSLLAEKKQYFLQPIQSCHFIIKDNWFWKESMGFQFNGKCGSKYASSLHYDSQYKIYE